MLNSAYYNFVSLLVLKHRSKHIAIFIISTIIVWLLSSMMFLSSSIKKDTFETLSSQPDFVIQKIVAGKSVPMEVKLIDKLSEIKGISSLTPRVYGRYFLPDRKHYFTIIGIDFFDEVIDKQLKELLETIDIKAFLQKPNMIIGEGVKSYLAKNFYKEYFNFAMPDGESKKVTIYTTLPKDTTLISNDVIITTMDIAKEILNIDKNRVSDIALSVPNDAERDNIKLKLLSSSYDTKIISKSELKSAYANFYNYKSGIFLLLFIIVFLTFMLILYQRYSMINSSDKKEIAILRSTGWSIKDVLKLKVLETLVVGLFAFFVGVLLAFVYVFYLDAPLLRDVFLGFSNLENSTTFTPVFDMGLLSSLFLFFIVPFVASVLIPVWKIAITDPNEAMR